MKRTEDSFMMIDKNTGVFLMCWLKCFAGSPVKDVKRAAQIIWYLSPRNAYRKIKTEKRLNYNRIKTMTQPKDFTEKAKARRKSKMISAVFCLLTAITSVQAQTIGWKYIARSEEGRYFVKTNTDSLPGGNPGMWFKILADDGAEQLNYSEWDCRSRRFRLKQTSSFAPDGTAVEQLKDLDWAYVAPETVSESLISEACGNPRSVKYAVIILEEVKLRDAPRKNAQVYRTVKRNERFPLTPFNPAGAWYQIYDPVTLAELWVHGNGIRIVAEDAKDTERK